jgi:hypothetical protein
MGYLDLKEEKEILKFITGMLKRRGFKPDLESEWEVHGEHKGMDYQVYIGYAIDSKGEELLVVIYPKSVYWLDDYSDWWKCEPDHKVFIEELRI